MKMAKASQADIEMALDLSGFLESLDRGYMPNQLQDGDDDTIWFDFEDGELCRRAIMWISDTLARGSLSRVTLGMAVLCDPKNELLDPDSDVLDLHPKLKALEEGQP